MITRSENWPELMSLAVSHALTRPFVPGADACIFYIADIIGAYTGVDLAADFRGKIESEKDMLRLVKSHERGMFGLVSDTMAKYGVPEIEVGYAQRGDLLLVESDGRNPMLAMGLRVIGGVLTVGAKGCHIVPLGRALAAWKI